MDCGRARHRADVPDAAFLLSKHAIPEAGGRGSIILIASQLGRVARPGRPWYCAAKGELIQLAKAMALDHAGQKIRVNSLSPGPMETDRYVRNFDPLEAARASHHTLIGRLGTPDEIAAGVVFPRQRRIRDHDGRGPVDRRRLHSRIGGRASWRRQTAADGRHPMHWSHLRNGFSRSSRALASFAMLRSKSRSGETLVVT
jgi:NAD(P)-dependent dehydrogenase (short-subunit alcohol dehydrogenase family)